MKPIAIIISLIIYATTALASDITQCNIDKYVTYSKAKEDWQHSLTALVTTAVPESKDTANFFMNTQILEIKQHMLAVKLLLTNNPERVQVNERLRRWTVLRPQDDKTLSKLSPQYASVTERLAKARERKDMPNADKLQQAMQTKIIPSPKFRKMYDAFNQKINQINRIRCQ